MKKKLFISLLLIFALMSGLACSAHADAGYHVADVAGLLTPGEYDSLEAACGEVSAQYGCGVYIVALDDYSAYGSSIEAAAEAVYTGSDLGVGSDKNGIMLILSMAGRDYDILAHGDIANAAFTDYGKDLLADSFLDNFKNNDWAGGFADFVSSCGYFLKCAAEGQPIDVPQAKKPTLADRLPFIVLIPSAISALVCFIFKGQMKTAHRSTNAASYVDGPGLELVVRQDFFTHRTRTVQRVQRQNNSGGGHGGTTVNSGGFSHKSGKF